MLLLDEDEDDDDDEDDDAVPEDDEEDEDEDDDDDDDAVWPDEDDDVDEASGGSPELLEVEVELAVVSPLLADDDVDDEEDDVVEPDGGVAASGVSSRSASRSPTPVSAVHAHMDALPISIVGSAYRSLVTAPHSHAWDRPRKARAAA